MTLLAHRREIAANATKGGHPILAAKGACDLLLDFRHPQISLCQIVYSRCDTNLRSKMPF